MSLIKTVSLIMLMLLELNPVVQAQFSYATNDGTVTITGYTGSNGIVVIPENIEDLPVTGIADWAFYSTSVTDILIPDSVTSIGDGAFFDCEMLTNITIGNSVASIGDWAFGFCPSLASVRCRGNPPSLGGNNVFYGNAATIYYLSGATGWGPTFDGHPAILWNPDVPFYYAINNSTITITGYAGSNNTAVIPDTINFLPVISIADSAFAGCISLANLVIGSSVTNIGASVFNYCTNLKTITVNEGNLYYSSVDGVLFSQNQTVLFQFPEAKFGNYTIPDGVTNIMDYAFFYCANLSEIAIPNSVASIGESAFNGCVSLTSVTIPTNVTSIQAGAFAGCSSLTNIIIPNSVTNIEDGVFGFCVSLTSIKVPPGITGINDGEFYGCASLVAVNIPDGVTYISSGAFENCSNLANVTIPDNVTSIGDNAFADCVSLASITLSDNITIIGSHAFYQCGNLTSIMIPNGVTYIGNNTFDGCTKLSNVRLPDGLTALGFAAFADCTSLTSIVIPNSVTIFGGSTFAYCANLKEIFFTGNAPGLVYAYDFYNSPNVTFYHLPNTTGWDVFFNVTGYPTVLWLPQMQMQMSTTLDASANGFGFNISWADGQTVVIESCTNLSNPDWLPMQTNTLTTGSAYFSDPQWTNYPGRFYRLRSP